MVDNFFFIEKQSDVDYIRENLREEDIFLYAVPYSTVKHPVVDNVSLIFIHGMLSKKDFIICIDHSDVNSELTVESIAKLINVVAKKKYVINKKSFCQLCDICDVIDINVLSYATKFEYIEFDSINTTAHNFYNSMFSKCNILNQIIPISKHYEKFQNIKRVALELLNENARDIQFDSFLKLNNEIINTLCNIEKCGLYVDRKKFTACFGQEHDKYIVNNKVYTQYNIFTSTGRPSNRYGGINFAALNKQDNTRECFVSRFKENGKLIDMDFKAFHPRLISNLINYNLSPDVDIYSYLATYYFNRKNISTVDIKKSKSITFKQLYGNIEAKYRKIPFFAKTQKYIDQQWNFFQKNGYIETPIYNRLITEKNLGGEINKNKIFNYILQSFEVETAMKKAGEIIQLLSNYQTVMCLYTYDSFLFDFHKDDGKELLKNIQSIMMVGGYPIKIKAGNNYRHMQEISL